jgi:transposase
MRRDGVDSKRAVGVGPPWNSVETTASPIGLASPNVASSDGGLKKGLRTREHTVIVMLDEMIVTETPPLYSCYGRCGQSVRVPITGNRRKRILHGAVNIHTGDLMMLITDEWVQETHQLFLHMINAHWCGWNLVVFEDRGSPHTADESLVTAARLGIEVRFLPRATPELNAMDHLWRWVKGRGLANRPTCSIDESADQACRYLFNMTAQERLTKAGVLSGRFWLTK